MFGSRASPLFAVYPGTGMGSKPHEQDSISYKSSTAICRKPRMIILHCSAFLVEPQNAVTVEQRRQAAQHMVKCELKSQILRGMRNSSPKPTLRRIRTPSAYAANQFSRTGTIYLESIAIVKLAISYATLLNEGLELTL